MAPRVVKDPTHPDFPHGSRRGYERGCREECCVFGKAREAKRWHVRNKRGQAVMVPAGPVREHVRGLLRAGATQRGIVRAAGNPCHSTYVHLLVGTESRPGAARTVSAAVAQRLMAVTVEQALAHASYVDKTDTVRLVRALQAQGWSLRYLAQRLTPGSTLKVPTFLMDASAATVSAATAEAVRALADEIGDRKGPSARAAAAARRLGFYPLIAYDDDGVLHREWLADGAGGSRGTAHRETLSGDWLRCLSLSFAGKSLTEVAGITGLSERTVQRARERVGIRFAVSDEWGTTVPAPGQEAEVRAARRVLADWDGGGVESRVAWKALMRAVAAARAGDGAAVDDEAA